MNEKPNRPLTIPAWAAGMRVDKYLARRFPNHSRTSLARGIRNGEVRDGNGSPLRAGTSLKGEQTLLLTLPGIAPDGAPPPLPDILHIDDRVIVLDKPAGLLAHPSGLDFSWAVIGLAKDRWPEDRIDLVHRLDRDTSGVIVLTRDIEANRSLKAALKAGSCEKHYEALCRGEIPWDTRTLEGPIGSNDGKIRIKMAVRDNGLSARTDVRVIARKPDMTHVACRIHTGRTHQIRVHLDSIGHSLIGDRMYGVPEEVFLHTLDHGADPWVREQAGAPRQALHATRVTLPHPNGGTMTFHSPLPPELVQWWNHPEVLPHADLS
jgi:23S rRNA pseudouridine1911/1915/1917 synthase